MLFAPRMMEVRMRNRLEGTIGCSTCGLREQGEERQGQMGVVKRACVGGQWAKVLGLHAVAASASPPPLWLLRPASMLRSPCQGR